jgi:hypothetical protein
MTCARLVGMTSITYHAPSRSTRVHLHLHWKLAAAFVLFLAGLALALTLHGSYASPTLHLDPVPTQTTQ